MSGNAPRPNILVIGAVDTKSDELLFMADVIGKAGGLPVMVDVSVLGDPPIGRIIPGMTWRDRAA
jgi:uncharacterized protein (UPF0261 family)